MKKTFRTAALVAIAIAAIGCAKVAKTGANDANMRYFNAWLEVNHPGLQPSGIGIYVLEEEEGTGAEVKEGGYIMADYVVRDLNGKITNYTDKQTAKQLGAYDTTAYYGPKVLTTIKNTIQAGLADVLALVVDDILSVVAENAGRLILLEDDGRFVNINLKRVLLSDIKSSAKLDRQDDSAKAVHLSYDAGRFHVFLPKPQNSGVFYQIRHKA
jgi:hypothetical protein